VQNKPVERYSCVLAFPNEQLGYVIDLARLPVSFILPLVTVITDPRSKQV
jgi:hypothetical protein